MIMVNNSVTLLKYFAQHCNNVVHVHNKLALYHKFINTQSRLCQHVRLNALNHRWIDFISNL